MEFVALFSEDAVDSVLPEELPSLYRGADFFVNPSVWESFSFQVAESMASGTPLLCSNRAAMPEVAGDAAIFFDPDNREELVRLLQRFAVDVDLRNELRSRGLERVKAFSWRETAEQTVAIYRSLVEENRGS